MMHSHAIWAAGLAMHLVLLAVLFARDRARSLPFFTLLICFDVVRSLVLLPLARHLPPQGYRVVSTGFDIADILFGLAVFVELAFLALRPLHWFRRVSIPLMTVICAGVVVTRLAPIGASLRHHNTLSLGHFTLTMILLVWAFVLAFFRRPLRLRWSNPVTAISMGFGVYSAVLLLAGGYFRVARDLSDYVFFSYARVGVYLLVLLWWILVLAFAGRPAEGRAIHA